LDLYNRPHPDTFFVLAIGSFSSARLRLTVPGSRALKVPILFKVAIRRVAVVLCELAIVKSLREILDFRFRKCTGEYSKRGVISYPVGRIPWKLTVFEVRD